LIDITVFSPFYKRKGMDPIVVAFNAVAPAFHLAFLAFDV
jgi:hypothetical protein